MMTGILFFMFFDSPNAINLLFLADGKCKIICPRSEKRCGHLDLLWISERRFAGIILQLYLQDILEVYKENGLA